MRAVLSKKTSSVDLLQQIEVYHNTNKAILLYIAIDILYVSCHSYRHPGEAREGLTPMWKGRGRDSDQKTWIKLLKETTKPVATLEEELKMEQESVYEQRLYCNRNVLQFLYHAVDFTAKKEL